MNQLSSITQRVQAPTPVFFKKLRRIGLLLAGISAAVLSMQAEMPAFITQLAGYIGLAGGVLSAVSQTAVEDVAKQTQEVLPDE